MNKKFFVTRNDGKKIAVRMTEASKENACPTIIFAHGFGGNSREILSHGEGFDKAGFNCVFFDFCGGFAGSTILQIFIANRRHFHHQVNTV